MNDGNPAFSAPPEETPVGLDQALRHIGCRWHGRHLGVQVPAVAVYRDHRGRNLVDANFSQVKFPPAIVLHDQRDSPAARKLTGAID